VPQPRNHLVYAARSEIAFPNAHNSPTTVSQCARDKSITRCVPIEFAKPKIDSGLWSITEFTVRVSMPKAPVHEHGDSFLRKNEIRLPKKLHLAAPASNP